MNAQNTPQDFLNPLLIETYFEEVGIQSGPVAMLAAFLELLKVHPYGTESFVASMNSEVPCFSSSEISKFIADLRGNGALATVFTVKSRCAAVAHFEESANQSTGLVKYFWLCRLAEVFAINPNREVVRFVNTSRLKEPGSELDTASKVLRQAILERVNKIR